MSVLGLIGNSIKNKVRRGIRDAGASLAARMLDEEASQANRRRGLSKRLAVPIIVTACSFYLIFFAVVIIKRGIPATVTYVGRELSALITGVAGHTVDSAEELRDLVESDASVGIEVDKRLVVIDKATLLLILDKIIERNDRLTAEKTVCYDYRLGEGELLSFDEITGAFTLGEKTIKRTEWRMVDKTYREKVPFTAEDVEEQFIKKGLPPPSRDALASMWKWQEVTVQEAEAFEIEEMVAPREYTFSHDVTLSRSSIEKDDLLLGDIFEVRWQSVLALTSMYIEQILDTDDTERGYTLTEEEIDNLIDVFAFEYYFYDDPTLVESDYSYGYFENRVSAYKLITEPDIAVIRGALNGNMVPVTDIRVYHEPSIAPRLLKNSYIRYVYQYEALPNGYMKLTSRYSERDPEKFLEACRCLIPDFEIDDFYEHLELLEGTEDIIAYYQDVFSIGMISQTAYGGSCPLIGTIVSVPEGGTAYAYRYRRNALEKTGNALGDDDVTINLSFQPSGSVGSPIVSSGQYGGRYTDLNTDDLKDPWFAKLVEVGQTCIGTPYVWGGKEYGGLDCSGFVCYALRGSGINISMGSVALYDYVEHIAYEDRRAGDLVFFHNTITDPAKKRPSGTPSHVGIYLGNGYMAHSGNSGNKQVKVDTPYWNGYLLGYGRLPERSIRYE